MTDAERYEVEELRHDEELLFYEDDYKIPAGAYDVLAEEPKASVIVLHNVDDEGDLHDASTFGSICGRFWKFCTWHSALRVAYRYQTDRINLEEIFRDNNAVDGSEQNVKAQARSLSVGDVVVVVEGNGGRAYAVESMGWTEVNLNDVLEAAGRPERKRT